MSVSKIFHLLIGNKSVVLQSTDFQSNHIIFYGRIKASAKRCTCCGSSNVRVKETKERTFRALNIEKKRTYLKVNVHKLLCNQCNKQAWMQLPFTCGKLPLTKTFIYYIVQLTAIGTLLAVALLLGLHWTTVKNIDKTNLAKRSKQFSFKKLRYISIDEIAIRKGHKYMTIFTDISTGQIIYTVEGRSEKAIAPFLKQLAKRAKRLRGIGIDMSASYASAINKHLPAAAIVYDRFHVTKLLNDTIDKIRRSESTKHRDVVKGQRFLLLRNFADLDSDQKSRLEKLLEINRPLAIVHMMKEQFRAFWSCSSKQEGAGFLARWIIEAFESEIDLLAKTARTLLYRYEGLLSYFEHRIDNGKAEGINNKIKVLKRQAYGFYDLEYFKLRLYHLHKKECQLVG